MKSGSHQWEECKVTACLQPSVFHKLPSWVGARRGQMNQCLFKTRGFSMATSRSSLITITRTLRDSAWPSDMCIQIISILTIIHLFIHIYRLLCVRLADVAKGFFFWEALGVVQPILSCPILSCPILSCRLWTHWKPGQRVKMCNKPLSLAVVYLCSFVLELLLE